MCPLIYSIWTEHLRIADMFPLIYDGLLVCVPWSTRRERNTYVLLTCFHWSTRCGRDKYLDLTWRYTLFSTKKNQLTPSLPLTCSRIVVISSNFRHVLSPPGGDDVTHLIPAYTRTSCTGTYFCSYNITNRTWYVIHYIRVYIEPCKCTTLDHRRTTLDIQLWTSTHNFTIPHFDDVLI